MNHCLTSDHADLHHLLGELRAALETGDVALSFARLDLFWARLGVHIRAEHLRLFPSILRALGEDPKANGGDLPSLIQGETIIEGLRRDHDFFMHELASAIAIMRDYLAAGTHPTAPDLNEVRARIAAVAERLETHNAIEEDQVYRWTERLLQSEEQVELTTLLRHELANLPRRYANHD